MDEMSWLGVHNAHEVLAPEQQKQLKVRYRQNMPYLFSNTTYARIYGTKPPEGYHELIALESYGLRICTIYEKDR